MNSLNCYTTAQGHIFFQDPLTGQFLFPCDEQGELQNVAPTHLGAIRYLRGYQAGLGWVAQAIQAAGQIFSKIADARTTKKANAAELQRLDREREIEQIRLQQKHAVADRTNATERTNALPTVLISLAGLGLLGGLTYLALRTSKKGGKKHISRK